MKIFKAIFLSLSIFAASSLSAQEPSATVRRVLDKFDPSRGFTVDFVIEGMTEGNLTVKGDRFRVTGSDMVIFGDKDAEYTYIPSDNEVTIDAIENSGTLFSSPAELFAYSATADYRDAGVETMDGVSCRVIEWPEPHITMYISADRLVALKIRETGRSYILKLAAPKYDNLPEVEFRKADYPGVEVIDFR